MNFENETLSVDYITLNLKNGKDNIRKIAQYFNHSHRFNCYSCDQKTGFQSKKPYLDLVNPRSKLEMVFVFNSNPVNRNTVLIQFSGLNSCHFYRILKTQKFNWEIFDLNDLSLGRFDISYIRSNQRIQKSDLLLFYQRSADKFKKRYPNTIPQIIDITLGLGTRTGDFFLRVYSPDDYSLKFELEIKKYKAKQMTPFLIHNSYVEFEKSMVESFFRYLNIALVFDTCYTDWLLLKLRDTNKPISHLVSNYFNKNLITDSIDDRLTFYRILQFLSFTRNCQFKEEILNEELYYNFSFPLVDFARQIGLHPLNTYQRKKLLKFFYQLQGLPLVYQWFSDSEFRSALIFPVLRIENYTSKHTKLMVHITVSKSFYNLKYPFHFPKSFWTYENRYDFSVKFTIIESICQQKSTRKILELEDLFNKLNNKNKTYMRTNIIQQLQHLNDAGVIQNEIYLNEKQTIHINKLTIPLINSTKQIIFYENI